MTNNCGKEPFIVSEGAFGRPENIIRADADGNMRFKDPSLAGTAFEEIGISLFDLRTGGAQLLNDLGDVDTSSAGLGYILRLNEDDIWEAVALDDTIIVLVESADWSSFTLDGDTYYTATIPHNLDLDQPLELGVELWDTDNNKITIHNVKQGANNTVLQSTDNINMYVVLRRVG